MALANTPEARALLDEALRHSTTLVGTFTDRTPLLNPDPWPLYVRYAGEKAVFVPRDQYYFQDPEGPSACLWIVPGSMDGRMHIR